MLPGLISGHYDFEQVHIDLARLCQWAGARFVAAEVVGLDARQKTLSLHARPDIAYDIVSIDIGSQPELDSVSGARAHAAPVKPIASFWQRWQRLLQQFEQGEIDSRLSYRAGGRWSRQCRAGTCYVAAFARHGRQVKPMVWSAEDFEGLQPRRTTGRDGRVAGAGYRGPSQSTGCRRATCPLAVCRWR